MLRYLAVLILCAGASAASLETKVRLSWGYQSKRAAPFHVRLEPATAGVEVRDAKSWKLEAGEAQVEGAWRTVAGAGDVDGIDFTLRYPNEPERRVSNLQVIWADLIAAADSETARRLSSDAAFRLNQRKLTVHLSADGTRGFSVTVDQLLAARSMWIPAYDVFLAAGDPPPEFSAKRGTHVLEDVARGPEATYEQFRKLWENMGSPAYQHPNQPAPGHIVGLTWDSAIPKFGIDRGAGVWNDYGNPDRFRLRFGFGEMTRLAGTWRGQRLEDGLPVIATDFEDDGVRFRVEQFAYPLEGPPAERRGDIAMVLFSKVRISNPGSDARRVPIRIAHHRAGAAPELSNAGSVAVFRTAAGAALSVQPASAIAWTGTQDYQKELKRIDATLWIDVPAGGASEFVVKLPSPAAPEARLLALDYDTARAATLRFWREYVARGARFEVPDPAVNTLFRASLWHALRLPRRHGGASADIDLPYSNFAYDQRGTPWPINQAVYVDYMLYDMRGYHAISEEELAVMFRNNQEPDGRVKGFANWLVYTPGMLYAVAQHYLLTGDRASFERLLPQSLRAMEWCLQQLGEGISGGGDGLVEGPLNDMTGNGVWAFSQAYLYAGLELFGRALERTGHPLAAQALAAASSLKRDIGASFGESSVRSPLVELRDGTWSPYVPSEARSAGRLLHAWYVTDADTGAMHLVRLGALDPRGLLTEALLNDHEDNLYYKQLGMANEPVYNPQATAYLLRDEPAAAIRAFYSYMACAFSHSVFEPVEHRWTHGQYFGPPSTDGAWFELYRNMLVREMDAKTLIIGQAAPRAWLADGKRTEVENAPTWFGKTGFRIDSAAARGEIRARVQLEARPTPEILLVRLRHPQSKPMRAVWLDGKTWRDFDPAKEWVRIPRPAAGAHHIRATY